MKIVHSLLMKSKLTVRFIFIFYATFASLSSSMWIQVLIVKNLFQGIQTNFEFLIFILTRHFCCSFLYIYKEGFNNQLMELDSKMHDSVRNVTDRQRLSQLHPLQSRRYGLDLFCQLWSGCWTLIFSMVWLFI